MLNYGIEEQRRDLQEEIEDCKLALDEDEQTVIRASKWIDRDKARLVEARQALFNFEQKNATAQKIN